MLELRYYHMSAGAGVHIVVLQYRTRSLAMDASGAFSGYTEWSEWMQVPNVYDPNYSTK